MSERLLYVAKLKWSDGREKAYTVTRPEEGEWLADFLGASSVVVEQDPPTDSDVLRSSQPRS